MKQVVLEFYPASEKPVIGRRLQFFDGYDNWYIGYMRRQTVKKQVRYYWYCDEDYEVDYKNVKAWAYLPRTGECIE